MDTHVMMMKNDQSYPTQTSVLFVENEPLFNQVLCDVLARQPDFRVLEGVHSGEEALRVIEVFLPNVVLLDLKLNGSKLDGVPLLSEIVRRYPLTRIIVLSNYADDELILDALNNGAQGYLSKSARPEEVFEAIRAADRGHYHVDSFIARKVVDIMQRMKSGPQLPGHPGAAKVQADMRNTLRDLDDLLTGREQEVTRLLTRGLTYQQIADQLYIAHSTVKTHVSSILTKMGLGDRRSIPLWLAHNGYSL